MTSIELQLRSTYPGMITMFRSSCVQQKDMKYHNFLKLEEIYTSMYYFLKYDYMDLEHPFNNIL
jgi:hypothetical protein